MLSYSIDPRSTQQLWALHEQISEKFALLKTLSQDELDAIHRYSRVSQVGASTRIENAILTDPEVNWIDTLLTDDGKKTAFEAHRHLIEDKFSKDHERSIEEVAGCRALLILIYEQSKDFFPLTEATVRGLHHELMQHYPPAQKYAGSYKEQSNRVIEKNSKTGKERIVFQPAEPGLPTKAAMSELVSWYNETFQNEAWSLVVTCEFVFRFLAIHPFQDGNGRLGRGLFLMSLLQSPNTPWSYVGKYLAIDRQIERHKEEYYFVLNRCSDGKFSADPKQYQQQYFLNFMIKMLFESLKDVDVYRRRYQDFRNLPSSEERVLQCFRESPELRLQAKDIYGTTNLARRTVVQALSKLVKKEFLQSKGKGAGVRYQLVF